MLGSGVLYLLYLLYWYKSTNTDAEETPSVADDPQAGHVCMLTYALVVCLTYADVCIKHLPLQTIHKRVTFAVEARIAPVTYIHKLGVC